MMTYEASCCLLGCASSPSAGQTFHCFPPYQEKSCLPFKDESGNITLINRRTAWMLLLHMSTISPRTKVCSKHFEDLQFHKTRRPQLNSKIGQKNLLRNYALPSLLLPKPAHSGERYCIIRDQEKGEISGIKTKKIIEGVTAYVCCIPDCLHSSVMDNCKLFVIPINPRSAKENWSDFTSKFKQFISSNSRICSCHFINEKLEEGPSFFPSDFENALCIPLKKKKLLIYKRVPSNNGSWKLVSDPNCYSASEDYDWNNSFGQVTNQPRILSADYEDEPKTSELRISIPNLKNDNESFYQISGFQNYKLFESFLSVFDEDCIHALTKSKGSLPFEEQLLLCLAKLKCEHSFMYLAKKFEIPVGDVIGIFERCTAIMESTLCDGVLEVGKWELRKTIWQELPTCSLISFCVGFFFEREGSFSLELSSEESKGHEYKSLISVTPSGLITYVGPLCPSNMSNEDIIYKSKLNTIAQPGDIVFLDKSTILQVKSIKASRLVLTSPCFNSSSQMYSNILLHKSNITLSIFNYNIIKPFPTELNNLLTRIWRIICALKNFDSVNSEDVKLFYQTRKGIVGANKLEVRSIALVSESDP